MGKEARLVAEENRSNETGFHLVICKKMGRLAFSWVVFVKDEDSTRGQWWPAKFMITWIKVRYQSDLHFTLSFFFLSIEKHKRKRKPWNGKYVHINKYWCLTAGTLKALLTSVGEISVQVTEPQQRPVCRCTRVKVIRVEVSQNVVHARTTGWMTSTRPGKLRDFGLQPRKSNPRSRNLFWALGVKSTWFLNFGGQAKCKLVSVVDSWPFLVVFGAVIPLWLKKHE